MHIINKNYLISPVLDFLLIGGLALFSYLVIIFVNMPVVIDIVFWMFILAFFVNSPHFMISYVIFYNSSRNKLFKLNRFFIVGILIPLILLFLIIYGFIFYNKNIFYYMLLSMFF